MRHSSILIFALLSSACTSFEPLRPDMEARPLPSRPDEIAYINGLRTAFEPAGVVPVGCYSGAGLRPFRPKYVQGYAEYDDQQEAVQGNCLVYRSESKPEEITRYLENGFGLTDLYCQRYFIIATETRQSRRLQRGFAKTGDTLLNAVLAALNGTKNALAISSAGFSAIDSGYGAIDDAFVVAPTRDDVRKLVLSAQQNYRADAFKTDALPKSYPSARAVIERYAGLCTFDGMRQLVADSVASKTAELNKKAEDKTKNPAPPVTATVSGTTGATPVASPVANTTDTSSPEVPVPITPQ